MLHFPFLLLLLCSESHAKSCDALTLLDLGIQPETNITLSLAPGLLGGAPKRPPTKQATSVEPEEVNPNFQSHESQDTTELSKGGTTFIITNYYFTNSPIFTGPSTGNTFNYDIQMNLITEENNERTLFQKLKDVLGFKDADCGPIRSLLNLLRDIKATLLSCRMGSVTLNLRVYSKESLEKLWRMYCSGELLRRLKDDLPIQDVYINEKEYKTGCEFFQHEGQALLGSLTAKSDSEHHFHGDEVDSDIKQDSGYAHTSPIAGNTDKVHSRQSSEHQSTSSDTSGVDENMLRDLAQNTGKDWKRLATSLGFIAAEIEAFEHDNRNNLGESIFQMLLTWSKKQWNPKEVTDGLTKAFEEIGLNDMVNKITYVKGISFIEASGETMVLPRKKSRDYLFMGSLNYNVWQQPNYYGMSQSERILTTIDSFSCHLRWQELTEVAKDKTILNREETILALERWNFDDRPTYYTAIRNLQGFIAYNLQKTEEAREFFEDALEKDPNNINALANLAHMCQELGKLDDHHRYVNNLAVILGRTTLNEKARAYADRAHAIRYFQQFKRCFRYMRYIERAAIVGRYCVGPQKAEWFFDFALALYRRDVHLLYLRKLHSEENEPLENSECYSNTKIKVGFLNACRHFLDVARVSPSKDYQALSWVFLGILVNHDPEHRSLAEVFPEEREYHLTPEQCFEKGLSIHPEHEIVLRRVGSEYVKLKRFAEAKQLLDKSLNIMPSSFGYRYRADMFLKMYEDASVRGEQTSDLLRNAVADFDMALHFMESHADVSDLGYTYFLLGDNDKALAKFLQATRSKQDDFFDPVLTHKRWAKCLEKVNQHEGSQLQLAKAKEIRKKVLDTPLEEGQCDLYFAHDFEHYNTNEKPGFVRILMDYHFWSASSNRRLSELSSPGPTIGRHAYRFDLFVWHTEESSRWAVAFVDKLESEHRLKCCIERRDFTVGGNFSNNISECMKRSYRCVIILAGGVLPIPGDEWTEFTIGQALWVLDTRKNFIIPIKVTDCPVPEKLAHLTILECEEGQIKQEHWDEIVELCQQT